MKVPVSILVPVKNEAANLPRCLASVAWADEIIVVDSQSTDDTVKLAAAHGAEVVQFHFTGVWPKKKNWALENVPFRHEWVFILDADEVLPPEAEEEIRRVVTSLDSECAGYWINRRFWFMGRWLRYAYYPNWNLRLFKHRLGRYEKLADVDTASGDNEVHEHVVVQGRTGHLRCEMDHYAFPSVEVFVEKHNRYSNWEARVAAARASCGSDQRLQSRAVAWRRRLKQFAQRLPCRPWLRFLYVYFWQRGFLDGREGYYFARLHGFYEFLSVAKTHELKTASRTAEVSTAAAKYSRVLTALFWLSLVVVLFFSLRPSPHCERTNGLPHPMRGWINGHDFWSNFFVFGGLAYLGFGAERWWRGARARKLAALLDDQRFRLGLFLGLGPALELLQLTIPGRVCDPRDMAAGVSGVLAGWLFWKVVGSRLRGGREKVVPLAVREPRLPCAGESDSERRAAG